jgi:hypothetical protein
MAPRHAPGLVLALEQRDDVAVATLDGDQRAGVEDERHRRDARRDGRARPRLTDAATPPGRARRAAARISSGVISPCSCS